MRPPLAISFTDALRVILQAAVGMEGARAELLAEICTRLLGLRRLGVAFAKPIEEPGGYGMCARIQARLNA